MKRGIITHLLIGLLLCTVSCSINKRITSISGGTIRVTATDKKSGAESVIEILNQGREAVDSIKRPVIGEAATHLGKGIPESPLLNFAADALLAMACESTGQQIDIALTNKGGLRSEIAAGPITFGDIYNVFPFENCLALLTLDGGQLLQLCREIAAVGGEAISGIRLVITKEGELVDAMIDGSQVDPEKSYRIATSDYLAQGNDRMSTLAQGTEREIFSTLTLRDLMVQYINDRTAAGEKISAECDGRITIQE